jgi:hypothetical protein
MRFRRAENRFVGFAVVAMDITARLPRRCETKCTGMVFSIGINWPSPKTALQWVEGRHQRLSRKATHKLMPRKPDQTMAIIQKPAEFDRRLNVPYRCGMFPVTIPQTRNAAGTADKIRAGQ